VHSAALPTPAGPFTVLVGRDGAVRAAGFGTDPDALLALVHPSLRGPVRPRPDLGPVTAAVLSYLRGDLAAIDDIPVEQRTDGAFRDHAWQTLRLVKPGEPITYTAFATLAGGGGGRGAGGPGLCEQRGRAVRTVSSGATQRRFAGRIPVGAGREEVASRARTAGNPIIPPR
jgi:O6-methylguanine-DNA--protein-cysteine methyltransferase